MNQKYEITEIAHPQYPGLYRIRALIDVRYGVKKGDLGGYVQSAENLSQEGTCWIADDAVVCENARVYVPFPVSWTVKMKKKQKETQDILSYHTQAAGCSDKARAKASGGRQPIEECGRTGL